MKLWRLASETRQLAATDLTGNGSARYPGRWNDHQQRVVYAAPTMAMCVLETAAHIDPSGLPMNRFLVSIDIPDAIWKARSSLHPDDLPLNRSAIPAGVASVAIGSAWLRSATAAVLCVPSVVVPEECIALINPLHPHSASMTASVVRRLDYATVYRRRTESA